MGGGISTQKARVHTTPDVPPSPPSLKQKLSAVSASVSDSDEGAKVSSWHGKGAEPPLMVLEQLARIGDIVQAAMEVIVIIDRAGNPLHEGNVMTVGHEDVIIKKLYANKALWAAMGDCDRAGYLKRMGNLSFPEQGAKHVRMICQKVRDSRHPHPQQTH
jgi:hypothetical protein